MALLSRIFRKWCKITDPKVVYLDDYKHKKRVEAILDLDNMPREAWENKYRRYLKKKKYRI